MPTQASHEKFDLRTHATDPITQKTEAVAIYRLFVHNGIKYFERPVGSLNLFYENNCEAGRGSLDKNGNLAKVDESAPHIAWTKPPTGAERLAAELAAAQAELAAIKAERDSKADAAAPKQNVSAKKES